MAPMPRLSSVMPRSLALLSFIALVGCSGFESRWRANLDAPASDEVAGCYAGTWESAPSGHTGDLRAVVEPVGEGRYHVWYYAVFSVPYVFFELDYEHDLDLAAEAGEDGLRFVGEADLGWLAGGLYEYRGRIVGDRFVSRYRAQEDHGVFQLDRVRP